MKSKGVVYCVTNTRNGKKYVGISIRGAKERWAQHVRDARNGSKLPLHNAIRKHGADAFTVRVLARSDDWEQLCQLEQHYIAKLGTHIRHGKGYNATAGGQGIVDPTEEVRAIHRERAKRLNADPEFAARRNAAASETIKHLNADPEFRAKSIAAASKTAKRLWTDDEFRAKSIAAVKRLWQDEEFRAKKSEAVKRQWADEEFRAKMSEVSRRTVKTTNKRLLAAGHRPGERTAFTEFCRKHGLDGRNVRHRLRKRGIYGLKNINDPLVRAVLDEMIAERQPAKKPRHDEAPGLTLH